MDQKTLSIPLAIVVAGVLIAGAVIYTKEPAKTDPQSDNDKPEKEIVYKQISETEHLLGSPNATIVLIEYSDLECPACQFFHPTITRLIGDYGKTGQLAWIYRHAPLLNIHPKAQKEAEASECAAELGGNDAFWKYIEAVFKVSPANNGLDPAQLPIIAGNVGLDKKEFGTCLKSDKYASKVQDDYQDAITADLTGTPHNLLVLKRPLSQENKEIFENQYKNAGIKLTKNRQVVVLPGAYPYEAMKKLIEDILSFLK